MVHPDSKILADILIHPLTSEQRLCIVRVCNLLNDLQDQGSGTATEEMERQNRIAAIQADPRLYDPSRCPIQQVHF